MGVDLEWKGQWINSWKNKRREVLIFIHPCIYFKIHQIYFNKVLIKLTPFTSMSKKTWLDDINIKVNQAEQCL